MTGPLPDLNHADLIVVFDNNAYGDLVEGKSGNAVDEEVAELVRLERLNRIQGFVNPYVLLELIALLDDAAQPAYRPAELALIALGQHCYLESPGHAGLCAMHDMASILSQMLYGRKPAGHERTTQTLIDLALLARERPASMPPDAAAVIAEVAGHVKQIEQQFVDAMHRYAVQGANPTAQGWAPLKDDPKRRDEALAFLASPASAQAFGDMQLQQCLDALGVPEPALRAEVAAWVATTFHIPERLFNEILRRIFTKGCDLTKRNRRNWIWDLYIACSVGADHAVQGKPLRLITTDGDILAAAGSAGCGDLVQSYAEYRRALRAARSPPWVSRPPSRWIDSSFSQLSFGLGLPLTLQQRPRAHAKHIAEGL